jgi:hypothetical protein
MSGGFVAYTLAGRFGRRDWRVFSGWPRSSEAARAVIADGCEVSATLRAPPPIEAALSVSYGPQVQRLVDRLARVAAT